MMISFSPSVQYSLKYPPFNEHTLGLVSNHVLAASNSSSVISNVEEELVVVDELELVVDEDESFLPHGTKKDGNAALQPIWLTSGDDNPNQAEMLFLVDDAKIAIDSLSQFARVLNLFDGSDPDSLSQARDFWRQVKNSGNECVYWQQDNNGSWHQQS